jgi:hypothetical protein
LRNVFWVENLFLPAQLIVRMIFDNSYEMSPTDPERGCGTVHIEGFDHPLGEGLGIHVLITLYCPGISRSGFAWGAVTSMQRVPNSRAVTVPISASWSVVLAKRTWSPISGKWKGALEQ